MLLSNRAALVLGDDEIAAGIAQRFGHEGARVESAPWPTNMPIAQLVAARIAQLGHLDILVLSPLCKATVCPLSGADEDAIDASLSRVSSTQTAMRAAFPALSRGGRGRILLIGHAYGEAVNEGLAAYNSAAWALIGLARSAAVEWGAHQITTNLLLPLAQTRELETARNRRPQIIDRLIAQLPLRRVGDPVQDIGGAATLVVSDLMRFVNGAVIHADGGQHVAGAVLNPAKFI